MAATMTLTVVYQPVENGWTQARIEELPAVITAAPTREAAGEQIVDALREYLLALGHHGADAPSEAPAMSTEKLRLTIEPA